MKKNKLIKLFMYTILTLSIMFNVSYAYDIVNPTKEFYVNDYANVLSTETKDYIANLNKQYEQTVEKPQVVVVTVKTLDNLSMEEYSVKLFEKFKIGSENLDNGVLIILAPNERKIRIEVGYGLEGAIPDSVVGSIIDNSKELLGVGDYSSGIKNIFNEVAYEINDEYNYSDININGNVPNSNNNTNVKPSFIEEHKVAFGIIGAIGIVILVIIDYRYLNGSITETIIYMAFMFGGRNNSNGGGGSTGGGGSSGGGGSGRDF